MCRPLLLECPDIIVGTPSRILGHVHAGNVELKSTVEMVVIDEADLLFSFGYEQDMRSLLTSVILLAFYLLRRVLVGATDLKLCSVFVLLCQI